MGTFKSHLVLGSLLWVVLLEQGLEQMASRGPCPPQPFYDSVDDKLGQAFNMRKWRILNVDFSSILIDKFPGEDRGDGSVNL